MKSTLRSPGVSVLPAISGALMLRTAALSTFSLLFLAGASCAESLPSFHLPWAAQASADIIVVQDGKVADVWSGDLTVGDSYRPAELVPRGYKVVYGFGPLREEDDKLINQELAKRGLMRVAAVSGKRLVLFIPPQPVKGGIERYLERSHEYSTVWLEEGQAFAIQQWMNPGPAEMRALEMTEAELKQAVLDLREVGQQIARLDHEGDDAKRSAALVALLKPGNRRWNDQVEAALRIRSAQAWPAIEPLIADEKQLPLHGELIRLAYDIAKEQARPLFERVLAEETEYFQKLAAAGAAYDQHAPPLVHHEHRRSAAKWALDSLRLNP